MRFGSLDSGREIREGRCEHVNVGSVGAPAAGEWEAPPQMPSERADPLPRGHRWNETNERCVVCLMSRREFDETGELCSREYRFTFDLPRNDATPLIEAPPVPEVEPASSE